MTQHIEIEFKNMLTKIQYEQLLQAFAVQPDQIVRQVNHYFDTPAQHLKAARSALRIRELPGITEYTLKEQTAAHQHLETTDVLTREQAGHLLAGTSFPQGAVAQRLAHYDTPMEDLRCYGSLTTDRVEVPYKGGLLVFDHSFYLHSDDYEVEYETNDETVGQTIFASFLAQYAIKPQPAQKKIVRFMKALNNRKG